MYALIENRAIKQYPYTLAQLKKAHKNVSFPKTPSDEVLASFNVQRVFFSAQPEITNTEVLEENTPVFDAGAQRWTQSWSVRNLTDEELASRNDAQAARIRADRDKRLADTDWTQVADAQVDKAVWASYRQALRDVPAQAGFPHDVTWPDQPE